MYSRLRGRLNAHTSASRAGVWLLCFALAACGGQPADSRPVAERSSADLEAVVEGMSSEQQALLWDIEHHGNILTRVGFSAWTKALREGDATALAAVMGPGFEARLPREP